MLFWLGAACALLVRAARSPRGARRPGALVAAVAVVWIGVHPRQGARRAVAALGQKHVIASYYAKRKGPEEPLIAWQLYWRGENFYTQNEIYARPIRNERTVFLGDHNAEKMQN